MAKTDRELTDRQAAVVRELIVKLYATQGSDAKVAKLLSDASVTIGTSNVNRWRRVRPSKQAADRLRVMGLLDINEFERGDPSRATGVRPRISPSALAELRRTASRLLELVDRIERESCG